MKNLELKDKLIPKKNTPLLNGQFPILSEYRIIAVKQDKTIEVESGFAYPESALNELKLLVLSEEYEVEDLFIEEY